MTKYINLEEKEEKEHKKTIFTAYLCDTADGWKPSMSTPEHFDKVVYLGNCAYDGDMFVCYYQDIIHVCKGIKGDEF